MTEEEQQWARFQTLALGQLDYFIDRQNFVGLSIDPSFERVERLFVSKVKDGLRWTYKTWDSGADYQRIYSTHEERMKMKFGKQIPTLLKIEDDIEVDAYKRTQEVIEILKLKVQTNTERFGLDGTRYSIAIGNYLREVKYSWWEELPTEWNDLDIIFKELTANLDLARKRLN